MTRRFNAQALVLLALIGIAGGCASERGNDNAALRAAVEAQHARFSEAFSHRDPSALGQLYAEDAQVFPPGVPPVAGRSAIRELWKGALAMPVARIQFETVEVDANPATAWETGRYTMIATNGSTMDLGKYIVVWKRDGADWKIYRDMWSSNSQPLAPTAGESAAGGPINH